jgi:uncharacterized protein
MPLPAIQGNLDGSRLRRIKRDMTHGRQRDCAIGVMAKAPQPGLSKTRLCPPLLPDQAAGLSAAFLRDMSENIAAAARQTPISGYIAYAPGGTEALFDGHLADGTGRLLADGSLPMPSAVQGFGRCLLHAITAMLARGHRSAIALNSDGPTLPTALLVQAAETLATDGDRIVFGPADDGGYYLLGMNTPHPHLFVDIPWSTDRVAAITRLRAAELGLPMVELPSWYDVDDHRSLNRLIDEVSGTVRGPLHLTPFAARSTRRALTEIGRPPELGQAAE